MKKLLFFTVLVLLMAFVALAVFSDVLVKALAVRILEDTLPGSRVSISGCSLQSAGSVALSGITVERSGIYSASADEARIFYAGRPSLRINGASFTSDIRGTAEKGLAMLLPKRSPAAPHTFFGTVELNGARISVSAGDVHFEGIVSFKADLDAKRLRSLEIRINSLDAAGMKIKNGLIVASADSGRIEAEEVRCGRMLLAGITGRARLEGNTLAAEDIKGKIFSGTITGKFDVVFSSVPKYAASLTAQGLQMGEVVKDLKVSDKVDMTGSASGILNIAGLGKSLTRITGSFLSDPSGGTLVVNDENFFKTVAERTRQPLDVIKGSFRDYSYKKGKVELLSEGKDLVMVLSLEGEQGNRDIRVTVHDFNGQGVEQ